MGYIDIHSHILPGVDDGARDIEQSLVMLRKAAENDIKAMIMTPHNKADRRNVSVEGIQRRIGQLNQRMEEEGISITLYPGSEILYRDGVPEALEEGTISTLAGSRYVLVEFMPDEQFSYIRSAIYDLLSYGYTPILAHVERYRCMVSKIDNVAYAIDRGALIQVNSASVTGKFGFQTRQAVKKMLKEKLIHFVATDAHDDRKRIPAMAECAGYLYKKCEAEYADALLYRNAERLIRGETI